MRVLFCLLLVVGQVWAQAPQTVVAQARWPSNHAIHLLTDTCGWPGGAMRAQHTLPDRKIRWGCWGYNETGIQIQWEDLSQTHWDFLYFWYWDGWVHQQLGYQTLHQRVLFLRNSQ
jgi:hypothetical protein